MARPAQPQLALPISEGVHIGCPTHIYDTSKAIGADDLRRLYWNPLNWWAGSEHNPHRQAPQRATRAPGLDLDAALATLVLQGQHAYVAQFAIEPDDGSSRWVKKRDEVRALLREKGVEIPRGDFTDGTLYRLVRRHGLAHRVFDVARQDYEAARRKGLGHLSEDEDRRVRAMARLMTGHNEIGPVFNGGLSDVAVFWRPEGDPDTLLRARFRKLRRRRTYELVPLVTWQGRDVDGAVAQTIRDRDLEIQRRLQPEAFDALCRFVAAGKVYAWDSEGRGAHVLDLDLDALKEIAAAGQPEWVWIFYQMPLDVIGHERGTIVSPRFHAPSGRLWDVGGQKIDEALAELRYFRNRFTLDRPWVEVEDLQELVDGDVSPRTKKDTQ